MFRPTQIAPLTLNYLQTKLNTTKFMSKLFGKEHRIFIFFYSEIFFLEYRYMPHNDVSVNDGSNIRLWFHKIIIL